jgi:PAT family beta-lactamase induction signal transducer AmpG
MALCAVFVGFSSATQDIVVDAWRIEAAPDEQQGAMAAAYQWGYRLAMIVAGAVPLLLAEAFSWNFSYAVMAGLMAIGVLAVLAAPRETSHAIRPIHAQDVPSRPALEIPEWLARLGLFVLGALILGSGLAGDASLIGGALIGLGQPAWAEALTTAWTAKPGGVFFQVGGVLAGGLIITLAARPIPGARTRPGVYRAAALGDPLKDFVARHQSTAALILALICLYRLSDFVLNIMNPFYLDLGFSKLEIAEVRKVFGVVASMAGVFAGGYAVARLGLIRSLVIGAFAGPLSNLVFAWLATQGPDVSALFVAIGVDNVASGFSGTCLIAYMSSLTSAGFTATQYALFSSLYSLPGKLLASQSGRIVESAAASAQAGGPAASLTGLFTRLPPEAFAAATAKSGVPAAALGAGYVTFFLYSAAVGAVGIVLVLLVAARQAKAPVIADAP